MQQFLCAEKETAAFLLILNHKILYFPGSYKFLHDYY